MHANKIFYVTLASNVQKHQRNKIIPKASFCCRHGAAAHRLETTRVVVRDAGWAHGGDRAAPAEATQTSSVLTA